MDRLQDRPFKPFRVHLTDSTRLEVPEAEMVIVGRSSVVLPSRWGRDEEGRRLAERWRTVSLLHVVQFSDLDESVKGNRRRRRGHR